MYDSAILHDEIMFAQAVEALQGQSETLRLPQEFLVERRAKFLEERVTKIDFEEAEEQADIIFNELNVEVANKIWCDGNASEEHNASLFLNN